jgi:PPE-repeat protein
MTTTTHLNALVSVAGPGSGPLMAAAAAWNALAGELSASAHSFDTVIAALTKDSWSGPQTAANLAAAAPLVSWLNSAAQQAEQAAAQARAAATAFEQAHNAVAPSGTG